MQAEWRNWAGDQSCTPAAFERPASADEVAAAVVAAGEAGQVVRVAGAGHSFTPAVLTDGTLLSLERHGPRARRGPASGLVRVEAGITLGALSDELWRHGLAFQNLGDIDVQSIAGATATGTHGTGSKLQNLSAALHSIELVTADGSVRRARRAVATPTRGAPRACRSARSAWSRAVTLQAVPAFTLEGHRRAGAARRDARPARRAGRRRRPLRVLHLPPQRPRRSPRTNRRVRTAASRAARGWPDSRTICSRTTSSARCAGSAARARADPRDQPRISPGGMDEQAHRPLLPHLRLAARVSFTEMEYAIPRAHGGRGDPRRCALVEERGFAVPSRSRCASSAGDDAFLSPAGGRDTCYIASHVFEGMECEPYFRGVEEIMDGYDGRPHWGKRHFQTAETLRAALSRVGPLRRGARAAGPGAASRTST